MNDYEQRLEAWKRAYMEQHPRPPRPIGPTGEWILSIMQGRDTTTIDHLCAAIKRQSWVQSGDHRKRISKAAARLLARGLIERVEPATYRITK